MRCGGTRTQSGKRGATSAAGCPGCVDCLDTKEVRADELKKGDRMVSGRASGQPILRTIHSLDGKGSIVAFCGDGSTPHFYNDQLVEVVA